MVIVINSVIGGFCWVDLVWLAASIVWLQVSNYRQLSNYTVQLQLYRMISEKWGCKCSNHIWGNVMVMINPIISPPLAFLVLRDTNSVLLQMENSKSFVEQLYYFFLIIKENYLRKSLNFHFLMFQFFFML